MRAVGAVAQGRGPGSRSSQAGALLVPCPGPVPRRKADDRWQGHTSQQSVRASPLA
jgi:hypothetical protein